MPFKAKLNLSLRAQKILACACIMSRNTGILGTSASAMYGSLITFRMDSTSYKLHQERDERSVHIFDNYNYYSEVTRILK